MTPNGWPASMRSMRPGTPGTAFEARPDRGRVQAQALAQRDDRERVVDVEAAGEPQLERARRRTGPRTGSGGGCASSSTPVARTSAAGSVP